MERCPFKPQHLLLKIAHGKGALKLCHFPSDALHSFQSTNEETKSIKTILLPNTHIHAYQITDLLVTGVLFVKVT
jgi:hypothetical protein